MKTASITEVRRRFSFYVNLARKGKTVLITVRNTPVAMLEPIPTHAAGKPGSRLLESKTA